jgi:hypothetical protein
MTKSPFHTLKVHAVKCYVTLPTALLSLRIKECCGFLFSLKNPSPAAGFEHANLGPNNFTEIVTSLVDVLHGCLASK